jgi:hypothetical protein
MTAGGRTAGRVPSAAGPEAGRGVREISENIESLSRALQQKVTSIGSEIDDISRTLRSGHDEPEEERIRATDGSIVNFGSGADEKEEQPGGIDDSELIIDHGKLWDDPEKEASLVQEDTVGSEVPGDSGDFLISGFQEAMSAMMPDTGNQVGDKDPVQETVEQEPAIYSEEDPVEAIEETEDPQRAQVEESADVVAEIFAEQPAADDNWDDMQVKSEEQAESEAPPEAGISDSPVDPLPPIEPEIVREPHAYEQAAVRQAEPKIDEEPIFDLFELGAEEYVEETEVNL